jgi:hypothetical protein
LDIEGVGHAHTATLEVEVWDAAPAPAPQNPARWDEQAEVDLESTSGQVAVWSMYAGRTDDVITLADSGGSWQVRVGCTGRAAAAALPEDEGTGSGVERYPLQFWPTGR